MRRSLGLTSVMLGLLAVAPRAAQAQLPFSTANDRTGYAMGFTIGLYFNGLKLAKARTAAFKLGLDDGVAGKLKLDLAEWMGKMGPLLEADAKQPAPAPGAAAVLAADIDKVAYMMGAQLADRVKSLSLPASSLTYLRTALAEAIAGSKPRVELAQFSAKLESAWTRPAVVAGATDTDAEVESAAEAEATVQRKRPLRLRGGLMAAVRAGKGKKPLRSGLVKVRFEGKLADGSVVVESRTSTLVIAQLIPCFREALPRMVVGDAVELVCPNAFGVRGVPPKIPGGATVLFNLELLDLASPIRPEVTP